MAATVAMPEVNEPVVVGTEELDAKVKGEDGSPETKVKRKGRRSRSGKAEARPRGDPVDPEVDVMTVLDSVPQGNYKVISFAVDLTGKKTTDEICQIAAYLQPSKAYSQYVMPSCDITMGGSKTHGVRVYVMFGKYRVLRNTWTRKLLKTKSLYSTMNEFLDWLKEMKGTSDGIILTYHDHNHVNVPYFLHKAVNTFKMAEDYAKVVKGVVNCASLRPEEPSPPAKDNNPRSNTLYSRLRESVESDMEKEKLKLLLQSARNRAEYTSKLHAKLFKAEENAEIPFSDMMKALIAADAAYTAAVVSAEGNEKENTAGSPPASPTEKTSS